MTAAFAILSPYRLRLVLVRLLVVVGILNLPKEAEAQTRPLTATERDGVRVVFPSPAALTEAMARALIVAVNTQREFVGLPKNVLSGVRITVSLAASNPADVMASAAAARNLIIIPLNDLRSWDSITVLRVVRHELAHVALWRATAGTPLPAWFSEGFAEWSSTGLTCEGVLRVALLLATDDSTALRFQQKEPPSRVTYDLYASIFEFLDASARSPLRQGNLAMAIRTHGFASGLQALWGEEVETLESRWAAFVKREYASVLTRRGEGAGECSINVIGIL